MKFVIDLQAYSPAIAKSKNQFFIIFLLFISCTKSQHSSQERLLYFDLKGFIEKQINLMSAKNFKVEKMVLSQGKRETKYLEDIDWKLELKIFEESDINKPAWQGLYEADTLYEYDKQYEFYSFQYIAKNKELRTQLLIVNISKASGKPEMIRIKNNTVNLLYASSEELVYEPEISYTIKGKQNIRFLKEKEFMIEARLIN